PSLHDALPIFTILEECPSNTCNWFIYSDCNYFNICAYVLYRPDIERTDAWWTCTWTRDDGRQFHRDTGAHPLLQAERLFLGGSGNQRCIRTCASRYCVDNNNIGSLLADYLCEGYCV